MDTGGENIQFIMYITGWMDIEYFVYIGGRLVSKFI